MRLPIAVLGVLALVAGCTAPEKTTPETAAPDRTASPSAAPGITSPGPVSRDARVMLARDRAAGTWPGPNGLSGVNGDPVLDTASVRAFCTARGRPCPIAHTYTERSSFAAMTTGSAWTFEHFDDFPGVLVISQGLVPEGGEAQMARCAAGEFDPLWRGFGELMTEHGRAASIVRLGWEVNVEAMPWRGLDTQTYISCFRRAAAALRAANPRVLIDWTVNAHRTPAALCDGLSTNCYPGDDHVDIIGIDNYDHYPWSPTRAAFDRTASRPEGLTWLYEFARRHGKPFSVGEWGVVPTADAGRENPEFVRWMHEWFAGHAPDLAYEAYFSDCTPGGVQSSLFNTAAGCRRNPGSAGMYRSLYRQ